MPLLASSPVLHAFYFSCGHFVASCLSPWLYLHCLCCMLTIEALKSYNYRAGCISQGPWTSADTGDGHAQDTTNSVWCFARLFHYPGAELLQAISLYCLRHWHRFKAQELANMIWSLALLRACSHDTWCAAALRWLSGLADHVFGNQNSCRDGSASLTWWLLWTACTAIIIFLRSALFSGLALHARVCRDIRPCCMSSHCAEACCTRPARWLSSFLAVTCMLTWHDCCSRVALLEKLATVPEATFDDADLHQLYQAYVLLDPPGVHFAMCPSQDHCGRRHRSQLGIFDISALRANSLLLAVTFLIMDASC